MIESLNQSINEKEQFQNELSDLKSDVLHSKEIKKQKEIRELEKSGNYIWDKKTKTLSFFYNISDGKDRDAEVYIKNNGNKVKVVIDVYNTMGWNVNENDQILSFDKKQTKKIAPSILNVFQNGINFNTLLGKENMKVKDQTLLDKIQKKAEGGVKLFDYYNKNDL